MIIVKVQNFLSYIQALAFLHTIRMTANIAGALSRPWMFLQRRQYLHNIPKQSPELERSGGFADAFTSRVTIVSLPQIRCNTNCSLGNLSHRLSSNVCITARHVPLALRPRVALSGPRKRRVPNASASQPRARQSPPRLCHPKPRALQHSRKVLRRARLPTRISHCHLLWNGLLSVHDQVGFTSA